MTREEFIAVVGRDPEIDDLDRVNCKTVGEPGHLQCGICPVHERPRFLCSAKCLALKREEL
jgi:hypothetical protein